MPKCTPNKADPVGNHLYHVSEEVWTPSPGKGTGAAGELPVVRPKCFKKRTTALGKSLVQPAQPEGRGTKRGRGR